MPTTPPQTAIDDAGQSCPKCSQWYDTPPAWPGRCASCNHQFGVYLFDPFEKPIDTPQTAMPDDVTCAFHPSKQATEVCDGTGSYICSLCAVTVADKIYSTEFINNGGLKKIKKGELFERTLPRPDQAAMGYLLLILLFSWTIVGGPVLLVASVVYYFKHLRLRRENALYRRVSSRLVGVLLPIFYILCVAFLVFIVVLIVLD